jgi:deoxyribodipyrimidine photo-lyase
VELQTEFASRAAITSYLAEQLLGLYSGAATANVLPGGRQHALLLLHQYRAHGYSRRNFVAANTSKLAPYLRHGVLSITEVAAHVRQHVAGKEKQEFLKQLAWREFFNLVLEQEGTRVLENLEAPKYPAQWQAELPPDIAKATTGLPCVDFWIQKLVTTGYLHNHERLWFAAYLVHWRKTDWKAGYRFFREHLLDGDLASNALSWQWVASTFSSKPYFMDQANIEKYSDNTHCGSCQAQCPFRGSYQALERRLFGDNYGWAS